MSPGPHRPSCLQGALGCSALPPGANCSPGCSALLPGVLCSPWALSAPPGCSVLPLGVQCFSWCSALPLGAQCSPLGAQRSPRMLSALPWYSAFPSGCSALLQAWVGTSPPPGSPCPPGPTLNSVSLISLPALTHSY